MSMVKVLNLSYSFELVPRSGGQVYEIVVLGDSIGHFTHYQRVWVLEISLPVTKDFLAELWKALESEVAADARNKEGRHDERP